MPSLRLSIEQLNTIVAHAHSEAPKEVCGLIAGKAGKAERVFSIKNTAANPKTQYKMDEQELLRAYKAIESGNLDCLAIYHSHPQTDAIPSQTDIQDAQLNTPNLIHLIISLKTGKAQLQAWQIGLGQVDEVELLIGQQRGNLISPISAIQIWAVVLASLFAVLLLLAIAFTLLPAAPPIPTPQ